jgi:hypothetical protein
MKKQEFLDLFRAELEKAAQNAETAFRVDVPRNFKIRFYMKGYDDPRKDLFDIETAFDKLFLSEEEFPLIIDVHIEGISINRLFAIAVVRPNWRKVPFERTTNYKSGSGPFVQHLAFDFLIFREDFPWDQLKVISVGST